MVEWTVICTLEALPRGVEAAANDVACIILWNAGGTDACRVD
jgi:hypothetical protein